MNEDQNLKDQLDVLFDELQEGKKETEDTEKILTDESADIGETVQEAVNFDDVNEETAESDAEFETISFDDAADNASDDTEEQAAGDPVVSDDTDIAEAGSDDAETEEAPEDEEEEESEDSFETEELSADDEENDISPDEENGEDGDADADGLSEDDSEDDEEDELGGMRPVYDGPEPTPAQLKKEKRSFWIFTVVVALIVAAAVLFILYSRGIIFNDIASTEATTVPVTTETTTEETTETEETTTETETEETTTEETTETEETTTETETEEDSVFNTYSNPFIVSGTEMLNLRSAASTDASILAKIPQNGGGELLEIADGWAHVSSGGYDGYVSADYIIYGDEARDMITANAFYGVRVTADTLNVRAAASTDSEILETVAKGTVWKYSEETDDFYGVVFLNSTIGYLSKEYSEYGQYLTEASTRYN